MSQEATSMVLVGLVFGVSCVYLWCSIFALPSDWLETLIPEMTY